MESTRTSFNSGVSLPDGRVVFATGGDDPFTCRATVYVKAAPESNQIIARTGSRQQFTKDPIEVLRGR